MKPEHAESNEVQETLPRGLYRRGKVLWVNKKIGGKRHQFSTHTQNIEKAKEALNEFLRSHNVQDRKPASNDRPPLPRGLYWKGSVIWLSRFVDGQHYNQSTGTCDPKLAEQFLADFNLRAFKGEQLGAKVKPRVAFEALADRYLEQGRLNGLRAKTLQRYSAVRDHFMAFLKAKGLVQKDVRNLGPDAIEDYKSWRASMPVNRNGSPVAEGDTDAQKGVSAKTLQFEVQTVGTFLKHGVRLGLLPHNPVERVRAVRLAKKAPVYLEVKEAEQLLEAAASYDDWAGAKDRYGMLFHDILLTYLKTGLRLEELRYLEWTDLDFRRSELTVRHEKEVKNTRRIPLREEAQKRLKELGQEGFAKLALRDRRLLVGTTLIGLEDAGNIAFDDFDLRKGILALDRTVSWKPKTSGRVIPLAPDLAPVLKKRPRKDNLVFPDPRVGGVWTFKVNRVVKRCAEHAGMGKPIHTHSLRHTFASQLRRQGVALETIKELLGHADIRDTLIYAQFSPEEAKAAIPKIDVIGNSAVSNEE